MVVRLQLPKLDRTRKTGPVLVPVFLDDLKEDKFLGAILLRRSVIRQKVRDKIQNKTTR